MRLFKRALILAVFLHCLADLSLALTVNMFAGVPLGGYGDIAWNVEMSQQLKRLRPDLTINFKVTQLQLEKLRVLVPNFDPTLKVQQINGINYYYGTRLPPADFFLGFALKDEPTDWGYARGVYLPDKFMEKTNIHDLMRLEANAPVIFYFEEYKGHPYTVSPGFQNSGKSFVIPWHTGARAGGYQISPKVPNDFMSRPNLETELAKLLSRKESFLEGKKLAFAYSTFNKSAEEYLTMMYEYAKLHPNENFVIIKNHADYLPTNLPKNLELIIYDKLSLEISRALIAHSEAPILVTGDASLSYAIEFQKLFLYEQHYWKTASMREFVKRASELDPFFLKPENLKALNTMVNLTGQGTKRAKPKDMLELARFFSESEFLDHFKETLFQFKENHSLPLNILKAFDAVNSRNNKNSADGKEIMAKLEDAGFPIWPTLRQRASRTCQWLFNKAFFSKIRFGNINSQ